MPTINDYIQNLKSDKDKVVENLTKKNVGGLTGEETFTELAPRILEAKDVEPNEKDVNFYDYDGKRIYSYTKDEFLALEEMPENCTHEGLIPQGWNYTLAGAKEQVETMGGAIIGQQYTTNDGKTRIYLYIPDNLGLQLALGFGINGTAIINWGDNSEETTATGTSSYYKSYNHTYPSAGYYCITIDVTGTLYMGRGGYNSGNLIIDPNPATTSSDPHNCHRQVYVKEINVGNNVNIIANAFMDLLCLEHISLPNNLAYTDTSRMFMRCLSLKALILPNNFVNLGQNGISQTSSLKVLSLPLSLTSIGNYNFASIYSLDNLILPKNLVSLSSGFNQIYAVRKIIVPTGVTSFNTTYYFNTCYALEYIKILGNATALGQSFINSCYSLKTIDMTNNTSVPSLNRYGNIGSAKLLVPDNLYEEWVVTENWSRVGINNILPVDANGNIMTKATVTLTTSLADTTINVATTINSVVSHTYTLPSYSDLTTTIAEANLAWSDGTNTYALGDSVTLTGNTTFDLIDTTA